MENINELTIAYLAMGARTNFDQLNEDYQNQYGSEIEIRSIRGSLL